MQRAYNIHINLCILSLTSKFCSAIVVVCESLLGIYVYSLVISFKQVMEIIWSQHDDCMHDYQLICFVNQWYFTRSYHAYFFYQLYIHHTHYRPVCLYIHQLVP